MIVGNGQLAQCFTPYDRDDTVFFASGVSNSNCKDANEFERESSLLTDCLRKNKKKKIVYFSSCALSAPGYEKNEYYNHKQEMEKKLQYLSNNYYIFRVPQLFGCLKKHKTLINFLYNSILQQESFKVYSEAYRYVIEIEDLRRIVNVYLDHGETNSILDVANPFRYKVVDIVKMLEYLLDAKANYEVLTKKDGYFLDLDKLKMFVEKNDLELSFSEDYLFDSLKKRI